MRPTGAWRRRPACPSGGRDRDWARARTRGACGVMGGVDGRRRQVGLFEKASAGSGGRGGGAPEACERLVAAAWLGGPGLPHAGGPGPAPTAICNRAAPWCRDGRAKKHRARRTRETAMGTATTARRDLNPPAGKPDWRGGGWALCARFGGPVAGPTSASRPLTRRWLQPKSVAPSRSTTGPLTPRPARTAGPRTHPQTSIPNVPSPDIAPPLFSSSSSSSSSSP